MNERLNNEEKEQLKKMETFLTEAFCIDGNCDYLENAIIQSGLANIESNLFALGDSKRGKFYVAIGKIPFKPFQAKEGE
jgi:hypothetical protein